MTSKKTKTLAETTESARLAARVSARRGVVNPSVPQVALATPETGKYVASSDPLLDKLVTVNKYVGVFDDMPWGAYLASGPPNVGKTITLVGVCIWQNASAAMNIVPQTECARYFAMSEPRAPRGSSSRNAMVTDNIANFPGEVSGIFNQVKSSFGTFPRLVVVDSMSLAMRAYPGSSQTARGKTGTMEKGMEVADQEFCREVQGVAMQIGVLIGIVGTTEVPFVSALEGFVEGMIEIVSPGSFTLRYRGATRSGATARSTTDVISIPDWALRAAATHLGYDSVQAAIDGESVTYPNLLSTLVR